MGTARKLVDGTGRVHWHGYVDPHVHNLASIFADEDPNACADCLAWRIQDAIEEYMGDIQPEEIAQNKTPA